MSPPVSPHSDNDDAGTQLCLSGRQLGELVRTVLDQGAPFTFQAGGSSMFPFIRDGDAVTVSPPQQEIGIGDVVAVIQPGGGRLVVHRVLARRGDAFFTKGDAATEGDGWMPREQMVGKVTRLQRKGIDVRCGLGPERRLIAALSQRRLPFPLLLPLWRRVRACLSCVHIRRN